MPGDTSAAVSEAEQPMRNHPVHAGPLDIVCWRTTATLVDLLGTERFERELYTWVTVLAPVSVLFAIEVDDVGGGCVLVTEGQDVDLTARARKISRDYAEIDYAADEVFIEHSHGSPGALDMVLQAAADRDEGFRLKYFDDMGTLEEISVFSRGDHSTLYVGFSSSSNGFTKAEILRLETVSPLIASLIRRHARLAEGGSGNIHLVREHRLNRLTRVLLQHSAGLTAREADVCAAIVIGYRAEAIADRLGISPNTVATHRKRAYAKLHISSQTELFGIFFAGWGS